MVKRGGKRRNRAKQWAEQQKSDGSDGDEPHSNKKQRLQLASESESYDETRVLRDRVEKTLVGESEAIQESLPLPFDITKDYDKCRHDEKFLFMVSRIWNYIRKSAQPSETTEDTHWNPSLIQIHMWSLLLQSSWNTIGVAPTGSGKTYAYVIPSIVQASQNVQSPSSKTAILALVPTRELVRQVSKVFGKVSKALKIKESVAIIPVSGGSPRSDQQRALSRANSNEEVRVVVVVATPGRILDLAKDKGTELPVFQWAILDEADQLAKDGDLGPQVDQILELTSPQKSNDESTTSSRRRLVLVSATYPDKAKPKFEEWLGKVHVLIQVDPVVQEQKTQALHKSSTSTPDDANGRVHDNITASSNSPTHKNSGSFARIPAHLEQVLHVCSEHKKPKKLLHTLRSIYAKNEGKRSLPLGMVFFSKIEKLKYLSKLLDKEGIESIELHSQLATTKMREQHLAKFSCGKKPLLLTTDLAARGIDIPSVQFVIQYDFPGNLQQYVHRCGRAGRSNKKKATIYSFFTRNLQPMASDLIQLLEANQAWVDPNLRALAGGTAQNGKRSKRKALVDKEKTSPISHQGKPGTFDMEEEVDDFPELSAKKIVLRRATHVSDASSSSFSEDDE